MMLGCLLSYKNILLDTIYYRALFLRGGSCYGRGHREGPAAVPDIQTTLRDTATSHAGERTVLYVWVMLSMNHVTVWCLIFEQHYGTLLRLMQARRGGIYWSRITLLCYFMSLSFVTDLLLLSLNFRCYSYDVSPVTPVPTPQHFPFCLIDAMGSLESCQQQIAQELRYQSSLDLLEGTYRALAHLPLAKEVVTKVRVLYL